MYAKILIPLDGSNIAEQVLPYGRALAKVLQLPVVLLGVVDPVPLADFAEVWERSDMDKLLENETKATADYLGKAAASFAGAQVGCEVAKGAPADVIIERAADDKTLIVMATHGRSGLGRWLLGSVTDKVLHAAESHLFLVRAAENGQTAGEASLKTVVVPLDGSALAEQALTRAADLAGRMKAAVVLLRAYALPPTLASNETGAWSDELINQIEAEVQEYLAAKARELKNSGVENVSCLAKIGYGADEIIAVGRETPDNFIMMCTHGRSGIRRWLLGSVTERVVAHSGDPVLVIRAS